MTNTQFPILLCTLNSTYQHSSFGLRYLMAQMAELTPQTLIREWTIKENPRVIVEKILEHRPQIVGFGVYIWNTEEIFEVVSILKTVAPEIEVILGGPEISYETEGQRLYEIADHVICGEADFLFRDFCRQHLSGMTNQPRIIRGALPEIKDIVMPYHLYSDHDIAHRIIYVEASRGCPYRCEYCLSSLDKSVRSFDLDQFLQHIDQLLQRGARSFKFVDRTFNLSPSTSTRILQFFLDRKQYELFLHFEMVPDRLPQEIKDLIIQFPAGTVQFEVGIQTLNPHVAQNVSRKNDLIKVADNFKFLREKTTIHTHADLIVGLPGETLESFAEGFDRLSNMDPDEIQVGILKRLKGTPIIRHEKTFDMRYQSFPPFQILSTSTMNYEDLQTMNRFAKFWDLYANSGDFPQFMSWIKAFATNNHKSFFWTFMDFVQYLSQQYTETHSIALMNLAEKAYDYLSQFITTTEAASLIEKDFCHGPKKRDIPPFLKRIQSPQTKKEAMITTDDSILNHKKNKTLNERQRKHL